MPISLLSRIKRRIPLSILQFRQNVKDTTIERLKTEALRHFVERRGFYLGVTNTLLGSRRRGPLMICTEKPPNVLPSGGKEQWVVALKPGEQYDLCDCMPDEPYYERYVATVSKVPLCTPLLLALEQAVIAMDKLKRMPPQEQKTAHPSRTAVS